MSSFSTMCMRLRVRLFRAARAERIEPPSSRTRSKARPKPAKPIITRALPNNLQTKSGSLTRKRTTRTKQRLASATLCKRRLQLKHYLETNGRFKNYENNLSFATRQRIKQLSRLTAKGELRDIPPAMLPIWMTPKELHERTMSMKVGRSPLREGAKYIA
ncbi:uncharacterized protein SETTUDRAFT_20003 [Exserohilum turcica Et28A]|uniref:Uncharacterized protein n=1 Tax=Exserohilum turcicum (strain 28A) TaxID=671987 RepID=R0IRI1_EXST2|nr:uncharacterized protein SETTUDRAFT_20003 [Exserohilum turcica Et28A]EOA87485.1 hypothetical protein SETTUDRAFT_20003 [Exserohilum turcica Et28A]